MKNKFLENASQGKNEWWRYLLTVVVMIVCAGLFSLTFAKVVMPQVKSHFQKTPFIELLVTQIALLGTFLFILFGLSIMIKKIHKRNFTTLLSVRQKFSWKLWWSGFILWAPFIILLSFTFNYNDFERFLSYRFSNAQIGYLLLVGLLCIGVQSTTEEILFRGYALQGISRKINKKMLLVSLNSLIFGLLHMGYGFESLIESFAFGLIMSLIVIHIERIEFVSGVHTANNLILISFFPPKLDELNRFQWSINWLSVVTFLSLIFVFYIFVKTLFIRK